MNEKNPIGIGQKHSCGGHFILNVARGSLICSECRLEVPA